MLGHLTSVQNVGLYAPASRLAALVGVPLLAVNLVVAPMMARLDGAGAREKLERLYGRLNWGDRDRGRRVGCAPAGAGPSPSCVIRARIHSIIFSVRGSNCWPSGGDRDRVVRDPSNDDRLGHLATRKFGRRPSLECRPLPIFDSSIWPCRGRYGNQHFLGNDQCPPADSSADSRGTSKLRSRGMAILDRTCEEVGGEGWPLMSARQLTEPMFLFSLPRAGSTLLQRILGGHPQIATASEPWILLPLLYSLRPEGTLAEYDHASAVTAISEFADSSLPRGVDGYRRELAECASRMYRQAGGGKAFFLDKTPRYHLIASEVLALFPDSPVIFLWRNPLAIAASIIETWGGGRWILDAYSVDLFDGVAALTTTFEKNRDRAIGINYEQLVSDPEAATRRLLAELKLDRVSGLVDHFLEVKLSGTMGDHAGTRRYRDVSTEPLTRWHATFNNPIRKKWARRYLEWIGSERLALMGYDLDELKSQLRVIRPGVKYVVSDAVRNSYAAAARATARSLLSRPRGNAIYHGQGWR